MNASMPDPSPLPSGTAVGVASGLSAVVGYVVTLLAGKFSIPPDVVGGALGLLFTGLTSLWHRFVPSK